MFSTLFQKADNSTEEKESPPTPILKSATAPKKLREWIVVLRCDLKKLAEKLKCFSSVVFLNPWQYCLLRCTFSQKPRVILKNVVTWRVNFLLLHQCYHQYLPNCPQLSFESDSDYHHYVDTVVNMPRTSLYEAAHNPETHLTRYYPQVCLPFLWD